MLSTGSFARGHIAKPLALSKRDWDQVASGHIHAYPTKNIQNLSRFFQFSERLQSGQIFRGPGFPCSG